MTNREKMEAYHAMETVKNLPEPFQTMALAVVCKHDETGRMENLARTLAKHKMPVEEIMPCIIDIFEELLVQEEAVERFGVEND